MCSSLSPEALFIALLKKNGVGNDSRIICGKIRVLVESTGRGSSVGCRAMLDVGGWWSGEVFRSQAVSAAKP